MQGKIKKIVGSRGFGFIMVDDDEKDIFFHRSQIEGDVVFEDLREGQEVSFEIEETQKGPQAVNIKIE
jgi:CspA family cold shock protein